MPRPVRSQSKVPRPLFAAKVPLTETVIRELLSEAGVDPARAASDLAANRKAIDAALARNQAQAQAFGFLGTPAFIVGTFRVNGGLDAAGFKQVIAAARATQEAPREQREQGKR